MRKGLIVICMLMLLGVGFAIAEYMESIVVDVSSYPVTGDSYVQGQNTLIVSSASARILISRITLSGDDLSEAQTVTLWDGFSVGASTANVTKIWEWDLDAVTSVGPEIFQETFADGDRGFLKADRGLAATKTNGAGGVTLSIQYK